ncbi:MAG: helix-turn-helix transcriptional regulator [Neoaquamicrobium sediminum]|uniref:helix-turn-helix transcriptional regulator n=1 Tax=Neoaquamicrobium sediminum TaxID=1849104 RepID=UPI0040368494
MKTAFDAQSLALAISSVGGVEFYPAFCAYLRSCMAYDNVVVIVFEGSRVPTVEYRRTFGPDVFRFIESDYLTGAYVLDPVHHFHLERGASGIYRLLDIAPDKFKRSRYYEWYYGRIGISDEISVILTVGAEMTVTVSMGKDGTSGDVFSGHEESALKAHEPVIRTLLEMHVASSVPLSRPDVDEHSLIELLITVAHEHLDVRLSRRQAEVALLILRGHSSPSIALHMDISAQTIKVFRKQLYKKCGISSQAELFARFVPVLGQVSRLQTYGG